MTPRVTRAQFLARVEELGATVDWGEWDFNLDTPRHYVWGTTYTSTVVGVFSNGSQTWLADAYAAAMEDMSMGLVHDPEYEGWWT